MLYHLARLVRHAAHTYTSASKRSSKWPEVRDKFLKDHPSCAACGAEKRLNVHHMKPFHLHPDLELDPNNFITLCMVMDCHLLVGHGDNFKAYNPDVKVDAEKIATSADKAATLKEVAVSVKAKRLYE